MDLALSPHGGLYALVDFDSCQARDLDPMLVVRSVCDAGVPLLQLRAKTLPDQQYLTWIKNSVAACPQATQLLVNDRADLAFLAGAHGVHLGQDDLPMECVRRISSALIVGVSTHDLDQVQEAITRRPTYLAFGPVFATLSKANPEPVTGLTSLEQAHRRAQEAAVPLVAIGGVSEETLEDVAAHCDYVAAIGLLLPPAHEAQPYAWITRRCSLINAQIQTRRGSLASSV